MLNCWAAISGNDDEARDTGVSRSPCVLAHEARSVCVSVWGSGETAGASHPY